MPIRASAEFIRFYLKSVLGNYDGDRGLAAFNYRVVRILNVSGKGISVLFIKLYVNYRSCIKLGGHLTVFVGFYRCRTDSVVAELNINAYNRITVLVYNLYSVGRFI